MWHMTLRARELMSCVVALDIEFFKPFGAHSGLFSVRHYRRDDDDSETVCSHSRRFSEFRVKLIFSNKSAVRSVRDREVTLFLQKFHFFLNFLHGSRFFVKP